MRHHKSYYHRHGRDPEIRLDLRATMGSRPYRARDGVIFGVCQGLARHLELNVYVLRVIAVVALFFTGIWPAIIAYIIAALLMKLEPVIPLETEDDAEFYNSFSTSKTMALHRLKRTYENLDRRIQRIENIVTARDYDWDRRLDDEA